MKITGAIAAYVLLATTASASPLAENRQAAVERRNARRSAYSPSLLPPTRVEEAAASSATGPGGFGGYIYYNQNEVTLAEATITVPTPSVPPHGKASGVQYGGAAWVGIQSNTGGHLWQTGVTWNITGGGKPGYYAWYEWFSAGSYAYNHDISFGAGDQIYLKVTATSDTSGTAYVKNVKTGQSATTTLSGQLSLGTVRWAEFLVEDYESSSGSIPFAAFSPPVQWTGVSFTDSNGSGQGIKGATVLNVGPSAHPFTSVKEQSNSSFEVTYIGDASYS